MATKTFTTNTRQVLTWTRQAACASHANVAATAISVLLNNYEQELTPDEIQAFDRASIAINRVIRRYGNLQPTISAAAQTNSK